MVTAPKIKGIEPQTPLAEGARIILETRFKQWVDFFQKLKRKEAPDNVHDFRVATRRLRAALAVFAPYFRAYKKRKEFNSRFRELADLHGPMRDRDIMLEQIQDWLAKNKSSRQDIKHLIAAMKQTCAEKVEQNSAVLKNLNLPFLSREFLQFVRKAALTVPPSATFQNMAEKIIHEKAQAVLNLATPFPPPLDIKQLHSLRIALKKLRYTAEIFAFCFDDSLKKDLKNYQRLQDALGMIHDTEVLLINLRQEAESLAQNFSTFLEVVDSTEQTQKLSGELKDFFRCDFRPGLAKFAIASMKQRLQLYQDFLNLWKKLRKKFSPRHLFP